MEIRPFQGWRYNSVGGDISRLIAPPYDVLSQADKDTLLADDAHNIVAVDLPHVPPKEVGSDEEYRAAAAQLSEWKSAGFLRQDDKPAIYAYQQTYEWAGKTHTRHMMIARVRATEFGKDVMPHEETFAGPKADRLKLTEHTQTQLSPIFGFYNDPGGVVSDVIQSAIDSEADASGSLNDVTEKLWVIDDEKVIDSIASSLRGEPVFIADGHHRYTTALNYRDSLGEIAHDHPANYVMFVLAAMDDPGLIILPTHRIIRGLNGFDLEKFVADTSDVMDYEKKGSGAFFEACHRPATHEVDTKKAPDPFFDADAFLGPFGRHTMAMVGRDGAYIGRIKDTSVMKDLAPDEIDAWRDLDVAILHRLVIEKCLADFWTDDTSIDYTADGSAALADVGGVARSSETKWSLAVSDENTAKFPLPERDTTCRSNLTVPPADLVVLLQGTPIEAVRQIALAGTVMPHKSTYFYPKVATGMVLYGLGV